MSMAWFVDRSDGVWEFFGVSVAGRQGRGRKRAVIVAASALTAVAAVVISWRLARPEPIVLAQAERRPLEARLSYAAADRWRPYDGGRAPDREEVRVDSLARLEARGEWRGLADGYLLGGEPERAAAALARAGESADVESDRAALALRAHDASAALRHAARALALAPGHAQAAWNRALALRDLALVRTAANAFAAIAARGGKGWSDEARTRAAALRAAESARERLWMAADTAGRELVRSGLRPAPEVVRAAPGLIHAYVEEALRATKDQRRRAALVPVAEAVDAAEGGGLAARVRGAPGTDAWSVSIEDEAAAKAALVRGDKEAAVRLLADADRRCLAAHIDYRCVSLEYALAQTQPPAAAEKTALAALMRARAAGVDPRDLPRRLLVRVAEAARAQGQVALADACIDEARLLMPAR